MYYHLFFYQIWANSFSRRFSSSLRIKHFVFVQYLIPNRNCLSNIPEFPSSNDSTYFSRHLSVTIQISLWKKSHFYTDVAYKYIYHTVTKQNRGNLNYRFFSFSNNFQRVYVTRYDFNALHGWNAKERFHRFDWKLKREGPKNVRKRYSSFSSDNNVFPRGK